jgi:hypothetical protein
MSFFNLDDPLLEELKRDFKSEYYHTNGIDETELKESAFFILKFRLSKR